MSCSPRRSPYSALWSTLLCTLLGLVSLPALAGAGSSFDHFTTSFELLGQHKDVGCEGCHVGGIFKGTPHECASCHMVGSRIGATAKPANHILSSNDCAACHTVDGWKPVAVFNHLSMVGTCSSCHNNVQTIGKTSNHIPTTLDCGSCHLPTQPWKTANFSHAGISGGCANCHNGVRAPGKPVSHLPTTEACETCHSTSNFKTWAGTSMVHTGISSGCQSCHETGMSWYGVKMIDRPTLAQDPVHPTAAKSPDCASCHSGFAVGDFNNVKLPAGHLPTTARCAQCHTTPGAYSSYVMGVTGHTGITSGCATCHATGKSFLAMAPPTLKEPPATHLPINGTACETCHSPSNFATGGFGPATPMNHAGITKGCQGCHETAMSWYGVTMVDRPTPAKDPNHPTAAAAPDCASCHSGFAVGDFNKNAKPAGHIPTTAACAQCHTAIPNFATYAMGATGHTGITSGCATCHAAGTGPWAGVGGLTFTIKQPPATHLPINGKTCETCHSTTSFATGGFGTSTPMNHAGITSGCQSCHETGMSWYGVTMVDRPTAAQDANHPTVAQGADCAACHSTSNFATGAFNTPTVLPATHMPSSLNCATCHTAIPTWATYAMGVTGHAGITSGCANCHATGKSFLGIAPPALKEPPATHLPINGTACETCHSPSNFATGGFGPATAMNHAGITNGCQNCHETGMSWYGVTMVDRPTPAQDANHPTAAVAPDCSSCHSGFAVGDFNNVTVKPTGHIPTTAACAQCHTTAGNFAIYTAGATLHTGITSGCATCHATGTGPWAGVGGLTFTIKQPPATHLPINGKACEACHSTTSFATGGFGTSTPMNHAGITSGCQSCHETGMSWYGVTMVDRPTAAQDANHPTVAQGADCAACHSTSNFAVGEFNAPTKLPATHIPSSLNCVTCHTAIPTWSTYVMGATGHAGITSGCASCHAAGKSFLGIAPPALVEPPTGPPAHLPIPAADGCETCHSTSSFAVGGFGPATAMNHAGITSGCQTCHETGMAWKGVTMVDRPTAAQDANHPTAAVAPDCASCHTGFAVGDFKNVTAKPTGHIPTTAACTQCHTTAGNYAVYTAGATLHTGITSGCATCHATGTGPWAGVGGLTFTIKQPPSNHIPVGTAACEGCHSVTNFTSFSGTPMKHAPVSGRACESCHEYTMRGANYWYGIALIWHRESANHHAGQDCGGSGCHRSKDGSTTCTNDCGSAALRGPIVINLKAKAGVAAAAPSAVAGELATSGAPAGPNGRFDHAKVAGTSCVTCHQIAAASHPKTSNACSACHVTLAWMPVLHIDHAEIRSTCTSCHDGSRAVGKPVQHIVTQQDCDTCHTSSAWKPAVFDHARVMQGTCISCHNGVAAVGKPAGHPPTTASCDSCHYTLSWSPQRPRPGSSAKPAPRPSPAAPVRPERARPAAAAS